MFEKNIVVMIPRNTKPARLINTSVKKDLGFLSIKFFDHLKKCFLIPFPKLRCISLDKQKRGDFGKINSSPGPSTNSYIIKTLFFHFDRIINVS